MIGGGAGGLAVVRALQKYAPGIEVVGFEQSPSLGGTWVMDPPGSSSSSSTSYTTESALYHSLRTNLPVEIMRYDDLAFPPSLPSFCHHSDVREYLETYASEYALDEQFQMSTRVESAEWDGGSSVWRLWTSQAGPGETTETHEVDALVVANGHFSRPKIPAEIETEAFAGMLSHSHAYREPSPYAGLDVLVVGAGPSGVDISREVATVARSVVVAAGDPNDSLPRALQDAVSADASNLSAVPRVSRFCTDGVSALLADGSQGGPFGAVILCTGYEYSFPFLSPSLVSVPEDEPGLILPSLYEHMWHPRLGPRLAFVGIPFKVIPFPLMEVQAAWFAHVASGLVSLPSQAEMEEHTEAEDRARAEAGIHPRFAHRLEKWDEYCARVCGLIGREWSGVRKEVYLAVSRDRKAHPDTYRDTDYSDYADL